MLAVAGCGVFGAPRAVFILGWRSAVPAKMITVLEIHIYISGFCYSDDARFPPDPVAARVGYDLAAVHPLGAESVSGDHNHLKILAFYSCKVCASRRDEPQVLW
jgi:hypothetical protein